MADNSPQPSGMVLQATNKKTGQTTTTTIPTSQITKEQFGVAKAPGEDNDAYAANYNTD